MHSKKSLNLECTHTSARFLEKLTLWAHAWAAAHTGGSRERYVKAVSAALSETKANEVALVCLPSYAGSAGSERDMHVSWGQAQAISKTIHTP